MGISLHGGSVVQPGVGSSTRAYERWLKGDLEVERLSLYGSSAKGTKKEGSLAGDSEGYVEKARIGPQLGNLEEDSPARDSERWMKEALGMEHLSLKRISVEGLEGVPLLGTLEDMLRKALNRDSFTAKGNLESGRRLVHWALSKIKGHRNKVPLLEGLHNRDLERGGPPLLGT